MRRAKRTGWRRSTAAVLGCCWLLQQTGSGQAASPGGSWAGAKPLITEASGHAILLRSGRLLLPGAPSQSYDPVTESWERSGSLAVERNGYTATLLADGRVLVAGGVSEGSYESSAELYEPRTGSWAPTGDMVMRRGVFHGSATLLQDGRVLVSGGIGINRRGAPGFDPALHVGFTFLDHAETYDPRSGTWAATAPMTTPRAEHSSTLLPDGRVLVFGGRDGELEPSLSSGEIYDPRSGSWRLVPHLAPHRRADHTATLLDDGSVLMAGGAAVVEGPASFSAPQEGDPAQVPITTDRLDPRTGIWRPSARLRAAREGHSAVRLASGRVLIIGAPSRLYPSAPASAELFDPRGGASEPAPPLGELHEGLTATLLSQPPCGSQCDLVLVTGAGPQRTSTLLYREPGLGPTSGGNRSPAAALPAVILAAATGLVIVAIVRVARRRSRRGR